METIKYYKADLEHLKPVFLEIGLIAALIIVFFTINYKTTVKSDNDYEFIQQSQITEEMVPVTVQEVKPLPPPPKQKSVVINIVKDNVDVDDEIEINAEATQETVIPEYVPYVPEEKEEEVIEEEPIFVVVESMPQFPGGLTELMRYLSTSIKYPALAKESGIQGKVFVSFVIEKDGSVTDISILRGIGGGCDEEAVRVVENMPKWIPGKQRNMPVRVRFNLPIKFTLQY